MELLSVGTTAANSDDFTIAAGAKVQVALKAATDGRVAPGALVTLQRKDTDGVYTTMDSLTPSRPALILENASAATQTFRVSRVKGNVGVDKD